MKRSENMRKIKSENTRPEINVRSVLHKNGYRYSLHKKELPGKPDLVLSRFKLVVFVHGCFWHQHKNCKRSNFPKTNKKYWINKLNRNKKRDQTNRQELKKLGYKVLTIWECETKKEDYILKLLIKYIALRE